MSIDAALLGRQKKWEFIIILLVLAVFFMAAALGILKKEQFLSSLPVGDGTVIWSEAAAGRDLQTAVTDSGVYLFTKGRLTNLKDPSSGMAGSLPGDTMVDGFCLAMYESLGREVYLPETNDTVSLPGSILSLSVGREKYLSAIISSSGYRTKTVVFTETGEVTGEIPLGDKTMVESVFIKEDSILAALCLCEGGQWECLIYTPEGTFIKSVPLDSAVCYELLSLKDFVAVRTDKGICGISAEGEIIFSLTEAVDLWAVSDHYVACISGDTLKTYTPDGALLGEITLRYHPNSISLSGNRIYIHFGEGLGCYSPNGEELWFRKEGSMALAVQPYPQGCILIPFHETS